MTIQVSDTRLEEIGSRTERRPRTNHVVAIALTSLAVVLVLSVSESSDRGHTLIAYSCALGSYLAALLTWAYGDRRSLGLAQFSLGAWMLAFGCLAYGLASMSLLLPVTPGELRVGEESVPRAMLLVALGFTAFAFGNRAGPTRLSRRLSRAAFAWRSSEYQALATSAGLVVAYGVGILATGLKIVFEGGYGYVGGDTIESSGDVAGYSQFLTIGVFLRTAVVFGFAARWAYSRTISSTLSLLIVFACEVVLGLLFATKESVVIAFLAVVIPMAMTRARRLPWKLLIAAVLFFVFVVTPLVTALRGDIRQGQTRMDVTSSLRIGIATLTGGDAADVAEVREQAAGRILSRIRLLDNQVVIMDKTPRPYAYRAWTELAAAPVTGLVPRAVWPNKPVRISGLEFYKTYYQGQGISSSALTIQGSLFLYGGAIPALLGMLVLGTAIRGLDDVIQEIPPLQGGLIVLIVFVPLVKQEIEVTTLVASIPIFIATYYLARLAVLRRGDAAETQSA
jgi:hypothetical protein